MDSSNQVMDDNFVASYQNEIADGEITSNSMEQFAIIPPDSVAPNFDDAPEAEQSHPVEGQSQPNEQIETNYKEDAVESMETSQLEFDLKSLDERETPSSAQAEPPEASAANDLPAEESKEAAERSEEVGEAESLIVPDEKTKRKDDIEEEINPNQCRICLATDDLVSIFEVNNESNLRICDLMVKLCSTLRISERDYLPHVVCTVCVDRLNKALELKLQCETTEKELRSKLPRRKRKARSATEFVLIDCKDLSSGSDDDKDADEDEDEEFHLSEVISSSSELDSEVSSEEEEEKKRPPPKRARKPPVKRQTFTPAASVQRPLITPSNNQSRNGNVYIGQKPTIQVRKIEPSKEATKPSVQIRRVQQFICSICKSTFRDKNLFNSHVQTHRQEKRRCEHCKQNFMSENDLQRHIRVYHTKKTPPGNTSNASLKRRSDQDMAPTNVGRDLFKSVAPLTTTYWSDSFSD